MAALPHVLRHQWSSCRQLLASTPSAFPNPSPTPPSPLRWQILNLYYEARDPAALARLKQRKQGRDKEQGYTAPTTAPTTAAAPASASAPAPAPAEDSDNTPGSPSARDGLSTRVMNAFQLRFHLLRCGTHNKGGSLPALFPLSSCTPAALPVTRDCVRPLIVAAIGLLESPPPCGAGNHAEATPQARSARAASLRRLLALLPSNGPPPSISLLFNPKHATLGTILRKYGEDAWPGCVLFSGASWHIALSPLTLVGVAKADPEAHAREVDFSTRGRHQFRPAPATAVPSGGRVRCCDPDIFVSATRGCFSLVAVPPKGVWRPESTVWVADPGECIVACGNDSKYLLPEDLYTPRQNWDVGKSPGVLAAEQALGGTNSRAWPVAEHSNYARVRALVRCIPSRPWLPGMPAYPARRVRSLLGFMVCVSQCLCVRVIMMSSRPRANWCTHPHPGPWHTPRSTRTPCSSTTATLTGCSGVPEQHPFGSPCLTRCSGRWRQRKRCGERGSARGWLGLRAWGCHACMCLLEPACAPACDTMCADGREARSRV